ncbi:hypothetical protein MVEN_00790100 [Mycena venus]|uniref:Uncharacterized protein n=1 Tax=Mycena venus TaxID=2733690 RepID=A0A8H6YK89_9AGAR|nr:hypothetical protein MVEN_00790100 [Mycena venus]
MLPTLPTEILEAVVDASRDNRPTLAACGAAGRQLLVRSRMHLFADIFLGSPRANITRTQSSLHILYPSTATRCDLLFELLQTNPSIALCATALTLSEGGHPGLTTYWISQSTTLVPIVRRLSNLRIFSLLEGQGSEWSPVLIQTMHLCLHAPSIESVELVGLRVSELPSLFTIFSMPRPGPTLQSLKLSGVIVRVPTTGSEPVTRNEAKRMTVKTLDITSTDDLDSQRRLIELISQSPPLVNLSRLRHLRLSVGDLWLVNEWIKLGAASLVQLDLAVKNHWTIFGASEEDIPVERLSILRFDSWGPGALSAVLRTLRILIAPMLIEILFLSLPEETFHTAFEDEEEESQWAALDSLISRQTFPSLTIVRFESETEKSAKRQPLLRERLPKLNKSGMLIMSPTI